MRTTALYTAAAIFALVGAAHLLRYFAVAGLIVAGWEVPQWGSLMAGVILAGLAVWMVIAARRD